MHQENSTIRFNNQVGNGYYKIGITCGPEYSAAVPGQFVTLKIAGRMDPLLRRPFSIHRLVKRGEQVDGLEILYRVVGGFTGQLSEMRENEPLDLLGPLGHGFSVSNTVKNPLFVAGGIGVAPIVFLAETLQDRGADLSGAFVFMGGKTASDILCEGDFARLGMGAAITTEDGSKGEKGLVTTLLDAYLETQKPDVIYACGPHGMLHAVADMAAARQIRCEVSIETVMACGLGVCMGCATKTKDFPGGYRHICKHGPVFDASVVVF